MFIVDFNVDFSTNTYINTVTFVLTCSSALTQFHCLDVLPIGLY